ncbi:hypothetical protein HK104_011392 [Borealophlyctis nickersoniae]|nr:hypothetical protein HK104_011392 [Borealophlyctis nickersoniae]
MTTGRKRRHSDAPGGEPEGSPVPTTPTPTSKRGGASKVGRGSVSSEMAGDYVPKTKKARMDGVVIVPASRVVAPAPEENTQWTTDAGQIQDICRQLFNKVRNYTDKSGRLLAEHFLQLPARTLYPDYDAVIKKPIAMNIIQAKIDTGKYKSVPSLKSDMDLLFNNAKTYNATGSQIYNDADFLLDMFVRAYNEAREAGSEGNGRRRKLKTKGSETSLSTPVRTGRGVKSETNDDVSRLFTAIEKNDPDRVREILSRGLDVNILHQTNMFGDQFTWSPLHAASYYGRDEIVTIIMDRGADIELPDTWYQGRALAWAAFGDQVSTCRLLVNQYGANRDAKNSTGQTAFEVVSDRDNDAWKGILIEDPTAKRGKRKGKGMDSGEAGVANGADHKRVPHSPRKKEGESYATPSDTKMKIKIPIPATTGDRSGASTVSNSPTRLKIKVPHGVTPGRADDADMIDVESLSAGDETKAKGSGGSTGTSGVQSAHGARSGDASLQGTGTYGGVADGIDGYSSGVTVQQPPSVAADTAPKPPSNNFVTSVGIVSNDDLIRRVLPMSNLGHCMQVPRTVRSLNLRLLLLSLESKGVRYAVRGVHTTRPITAGVQSRNLNFVVAGSNVYDCLVIVEEGVNSFEFTVTAQHMAVTMSQSFTLFINRV